MYMRQSLLSMHMTVQTSRPHNLRNKAETGRMSSPNTIPFITMHAFQGLQTTLIFILLTINMLVILQSQQCRKYPFLRPCFQYNSSQFHIFFIEASCFFMPFVSFLSVSDMFILFLYTIDNFQTFLF